jgi:hypothetical protein
MGRILDGLADRSLAFGMLLLCIGCGVLTYRAPTAGLCATLIIAMLAILAGARDKGDLPHDR